MSEAVHEISHEATHAAAHGARSFDRKVGLLISVLALFLAIAEMQGKSAQTSALALNIQAANLWNFFQAKTVRQTVLRTASEEMALHSDVPGRQAQIEAWKSTIDRWETEPSTGEGRRELMARAKETERKRDLAFGAHHAYEIASLVLQLGIVLASVTLISGLLGFAYASGVLGIAGLFLLAGLQIAPDRIVALLPH
jgi:hypothetical protein